MKTILVATDFSVRSDRALLRAKLIARQTGAGLVVVHVVDEEQPERLIDTGRRSAQGVLFDLAEMLRQDGVEAEPNLQVSDVPTGILTAADDVDADLIIVGPHRSRALDVFTGTTVERIVRSSRRPLLVAVEVPSAGYRRSLIAIDFDEPSKAAACAALALGVFDHTHVTIMHAFDTPAAGMMRRGMLEAELIDDHKADQRQAAGGRLDALIDELGLPRSTTRLVSMKGTPARTILESARNEAADLVIVGTSQRKGFQRFLVGSVTNDVIRDTHRDILIVPVP